MARGERVIAFKPVVTGLDAPVAGAAADHELLAACAGMDPEAVTPHRFGLPASPHLAAAVAGAAIDVPALVAAARAAAGDVLVVEGVGGLLVPLADGWDIRAFAGALGLPVLIAARPGLGTINHTLLTLEAARAGGLDVRAVVLTPWPTQPSVVEESNRETIGRIGRVAVAVLGRVAPVAPAELGRAGATLPIDIWVEPRH
ncbi:MAG: dethiobiotin synthetase [Solirubrobacteraceae bacterium]|nr:dethiobiotin synthetase [Solirubrobacteraceae bacterium]